MRKQSIDLRAASHIDVLEGDGTFELTVARTWESAPKSTKTPTTSFPHYQSNERMDVPFEKFPAGCAAHRRRLHK